MCISAIQDEWLTLWANPPLSSFHPTQAIWLTNRGGGALCLIILQLLVLLTLFALLLQLLDPFLAHFPPPISAQSNDTTICVLLSMWREMASEVAIVTYLEQDRTRCFILLSEVIVDRVMLSTCCVVFFLPIFLFPPFSIRPRGFYSSDVLNTRFARSAS